MLAIIFLIMSFVFLIVGIVTIMSDYNGEAIGPGFTIILIVLGLNLFPVFTHIPDIALIRNQALLIEVRQSAISQINKDLAEFPQFGQLMNADSPIKTLIETKSQYLAQLTELKIKIAAAKLNIEKRKIGPSAWVVWMMGDK